MRNFNIPKDVSYNSFEELRAAVGLKPSTRRTSNEAKLQSQKEKFCNRHKCKACGQPMTWIGGNQMACTNENCKGIKVERTDNDGNTIVSYVTSYHLLDKVGAKIAENIFS